MDEEKLQYMSIYNLQISTELDAASFITLKTNSSCIFGCMTKMKNSDFYRIFDQF